MTVLHRVALIDENRRIRDSLALVLTSTGGMKVNGFCSLDDYLLSHADKNEVQLIICSYGLCNAELPRLKQPIFCYSSTVKKSRRNIPNIYLDPLNLPAFAEQVHQRYCQLINQE